MQVNIASVPNGLPYDSTCIIQPGEHRFIKHESYVCYAKARIEAANALLRGVKAGQLIPRIILVKRICDGLRQSPHTTPTTVFLRFNGITD